MEASRSSGKKKRKGRQPASSGDDTGASAATPKLNAVREHGMAPSSRAPATPPKAAAYAGATFHASPAPSSLPIPSFFSKSVPDLPAIDAQTKAANGERSPTRPTTSVVAGQHDRGDSPLDIFFQADREEKARAKLRTPSATPKNSPFSSLPRSPQTGEDSPSMKARRNHTRHPTDSSIGGIFPLEIDRSHELSSHSPGPSFATPYKERMNAFRSKPSAASPGAPDSEDDHDRKTQALKQMLMSSPHQNAAGPPTQGKQDTSQKLVSAAASSSSRQGAMTTGPARPPPMNGPPQIYPSGTHNGQEQSFPAPNSGAGHRPKNSATRFSNLRQEVVIPQKGPTERSNQVLPLPPRNQKHDAYNVPRDLLNAHINGDLPGNAASSHRSVSEPYAGRGESAGPTNQRNANGNAHVESLEADLRRMLKLGSRDASAVSDGSLSSSKSPAVPNGAAHRQAS